MKQRARRPIYQAMNDFSACIIPSPPAAEGYVELGSRGTTGAVFRKHILTLGDLHYGGKTWTLGEDFYDQLKRNFDSGVSIVQVPVADARNRHTEDPLRNAGEVVGLEREGDKVYATLDIRDPEVAKRIADGRVLGVSAMLSMDYKDSRTDQRVGPALLHACITNRPHVLGLEPYQEVVAATGGFDSPVVLGYGAGPDDEDELPVLTVVEDDPLDAADSDADAPAALASVVDGEMLLDALCDVVGLSAGSHPQEVTDNILRLVAEHAKRGECMVELTQENIRLDSELTAARREAAELAVDGYIADGRLFAKSREKGIELYLSGDLDDFLSPASDPLIEMNHQAGITGEGDGAMQHQFDIDAEIRRYGEIASASGAKK